MSTLIETIATHQRAHSADNAAIRPFRVSVPEAELTDLRQCLDGAKSPDRLNRPTLLRDAEKEIE